MLGRAAAARYTEWSLRATPADRRQRYFHRAGREFALDDAIRSMVAFEVRNLVDHDPAFWRPEAFDIIFFRNVAIYFSPETMKTVIARLSQSLAPGGFLFLGPSETLRGVSTAFHLRHTHETFYYEHLRPGESRRRPVQVSPMERLVLEPSPVLEQAPDESWVEEIHRAAERISKITSGRAKPPPGSATHQPPGNLELVRELLRQERFDDALAALRQLPAASAGDVDAQLLNAAISTNMGRVHDAEHACRQVLATDELNAGAHYLLALCREHAGDRAGAAEHDQTAIYLDPAFAMPHFHLGMMTRRSGDLTTARHELQQALTLLEREDAARILLFGGGFSREALVQLCNATLRTCGGAP